MTKPKEMAKWMKRIAILNFKDGTDKIITAVNLSHALALQRQINRIFTGNSWKKKPAFGAGCNIRFSTRLTSTEIWVRLFFRDHHSVDSNLASGIMGGERIDYFEVVVQNFGIDAANSQETNSPVVTRRYIGVTQEEINNIEEKVCL